MFQWALGHLWQTLSVSIKELLGRNPGIWRNMKITFHNMWRSEHEWKSSGLFSAFKWKYYFKGEYPHSQMTHGNHMQEINWRPVEVLVACWSLDSLPSPEVVLSSNFCQRTPVAPGKSKVAAFLQQQPIWAKVKPSNNIRASLVKIIWTLMMFYKSVKNNYSNRSLPRKQLLRPHPSQTVLL